MSVGNFVYYGVWPRGLRRGSASNRLLGLRAQIPPEAQMSCLLWVLCVVRLSLGRADDSSSGVLPSVVCLSVIVKPR